MIVVKSKDKDRYLTALNRCDVNVGPVPSAGAHAKPEQLVPFVEYMTKCLETALTVCIKAAKGESIEEDDDFQKQIKLLQRKAEKGRIHEAGQTLLKIRLICITNYCFPIRRR